MQAVEDARKEQLKLKAQEAEYQRLVGGMAKSAGRKDDGGGITSASREVCQPSPHKIVCSP